MVCVSAFWCLSQHLPSYLGFSYLGRGVSLHGCSSKVQPLLLTLDEGYLLTVAPSDLEHGVAPLSPPVPVQPPLLGRCLMLLISLFYRRPTIKFREVRLAQDHTASENHINNVRPDLFDLNTHDISWVFRSNRSGLTLLMWFSLAVWSWASLTSLNFIVGLL